MENYPYETHVDQTDTQNLFRTWISIPLGYKNAEDCGEIVDDREIDQIIKIRRRNTRQRQDSRKMTVIQMTTS